MTILFEQIDDGETETPPPAGSGIGSLRLRCVGYGEVSGGMGTMSLRLRMGGVGEGGSELEEPMIAIGEMSMALASGYSFGPLVAEPAEGSMSLRLRGGFASGTTGYDTDAVGDMALRLSMYGMGPWDPDDPDAPPPPPDHDSVLLSDWLSGSESLTTNMTVRLASELRAVSRIRAEWTTNGALADSLAFGDQLDAIYRELLTSSMEFGETAGIDHIAMVRLHDALLLDGTCSSSLEAAVLLADAIAFGTMLSAAEILTLADSLEFSDAVAQSYHGAALLVDSLLAGDTGVASASFTVLLSDAIALDAEQTVTMDLLAVLRDGLSFVSHLSFNDEQYIAWAMNVDTRALTKFTNYPFNSFLRTSSGKAYGIAEGALCRLGGGTDAGEPINAKLRLGMSDLGSRRVKRTPAMYLGFTGNGDMYIKAIQASPVDGQREAHIYRMHPRLGDNPETSRRKIGRGLKAVYFDYEIENIEGSDFSIDVIEIHVLPLDRRLRGDAGRP